MELMFLMFSESCFHEGWNFLTKVLSKIRQLSNLLLFGRHLFVAYIFEVGLILIADSASSSSFQMRSKVSLVSRSNFRLMFPSF